jgi:hypothetical protein
MNSLKKIAFVFGSIVVIIAVTAGFSASSPPAGCFRSFEFTYLTRIPSLPAGSKVSRIWIPLLQSDRYQTIGDLKIESPFPYAHHRDPGYGNEYLYLQVPVDKVTAAAEVRIGFARCDDGALVLRRLAADSNGLAGGGLVSELPVILPELAAGAMITSHKPTSHYQSFETSQNPVSGELPS